MENLFKKIFLGLMVLSSSSAKAAQSFTVQGRLLNTDGTAVTSASVQFRIQVKSPGVEDCLLYQETQTLNLSQSQGTFALTVGQGTRAANTVDGGNSLNTVFSNSSAISLTSATSPCGSGATSYTPAVSDTRKLNLSFDEGSGWDTIPTITLNWVPQAMHAQNADSLGSVSSTQFLKVAAGTTPAAISGAAYTELSTLLAGTNTTYVKSSGLPVCAASEFVTAGAGGVLTCQAGSSASSLPLAGGTMTGSLLMPDGTTALPSMTFSGETGTGFSRTGASKVSVSLGGTQRGYFVSNAIQWADGTAALPTYSFVAAGDTGMFRASPDLAFSVAGTESLRLKSGGNVGVGTTAPASKLHIAADNTTSVNYGVVSIGAGAFDGSTSGKFTGHASGTELAVNAASGFGGALLDLQTNGVTKFRVSNAGLLECGAIYATSLQSSSGSFGTSSPNTAITIQSRDFSSAVTGISMITGTISNTSGSFIPVAIKPIYNQTSGSSANTDFLINRTQNAVGSGNQFLIDAQVGGATKFNVSNTGVGYFDSKLGVGVASPSTRLHVVGSSGTAVATFSDGSATCTVTPATAGSISCSSDERLKRDIASVNDDSSLEKILSLETVTYRWKHDSEKIHTGYIAQEVEKVTPEFVTEDNRGFKQVSYVGLIPLITGAMKALNEKFEGLKKYLTSKAEQSEVDLLKQEVNNLKQENALIRTYLCKSNPSAEVCSF